MKQQAFFPLLLIFLISLLNAQESHQPGFPPQPDLHEHKDHLWQRYLNAVQNEDIDISQKNFDALYYRLELKVEYEPEKLTGTVTGRFASTHEQLANLILNMDDRLEISKVSGNVSEYHHQNQLLEISLDKSYQKGEHFEISVSYAGVPAAGTGYNYFRFDRMDDGSPHVWTLSEPYGARYWWPCKDSPRDKPDSVDIIVTVPEGQLVASNGTLRKVVQNRDSTTTFHWHEQYPIATYLVSLAIGNYARFQDQYISLEGDTLPLDYYVYPSDLSVARSAFTEMHDYLDALSYYFGPYPFMEEKYGMAQFGWGGGMEHQTITSIGRVSENWRYLYVHELGHQWFGDLITCDSWQDIWLNEGFASYSEALYAEWAGFGGNPPGEDAYFAYMATQQYFKGGTIFREDTTSFASLFDRIVYDKGSWVLHMLRRIVGDENFFIILKEYLNDPRWRFASVKTENFIEICESVSGMDLDVFFDQWLNYPYYPEYGYNWKSVGQKDGRYVAEVKIVQKQNTIIYEMPIDLKFQLASGADTVVTVENNQAEQKYIFHFTAEPVRFDFDPENWILKQSETYIESEFTSEVVIEEYYPNPFNEEVTIRVRNWYFDTISLEVYDIAGKKLRELNPVNSYMDHTYEFRWDGTNENGMRVSSGVYVVIPGGKKATGTHAFKLIKLK